MKFYGSKIKFNMAGSIFSGRIVGFVTGGYKVKVRGHDYPVPVSYDMVIG